MVYLARCTYPSPPSCPSSDSTPMNLQLPFPGLPRPSHNAARATQTTYVRTSLHNHFLSSLWLLLFLSLKVVGVGLVELVLESEMSGCYMMYSCRCCS